MHVWICILLLLLLLNESLTILSFMLIKLETLWFLLKRFLLLQYFFSFYVFASFANVKAFTCYGEMFDRHFLLNTRNVYCSIFNFTQWSLKLIKRNHLASLFIHSIAYRKKSSNFENNLPRIKSIAIAKSNGNGCHQAIKIRTVI